MRPLAQNTSTMQESGIRRLMHKSADVPKAIHLETGQPDFITPNHIIEAACEAMKKGYTGYTPSAGYASLREIIADKAMRVNKIKASTENVVVTVGGVSGITTTLFALIDQGDEVLIPNPCWPNYTMAIACCAGRAISYPCYQEYNFEPKLDDMKRLITSKTKAIIVNTPTNPTGSVYCSDTIEGIVDIARKFDLYVISDEAYEDIVFEGEHVSAATFDTEGRVISIYTLSKSYAMTGWRVGYVISEPKIVKLLTKIQEPFSSCAPSISQKAAEAAITGPQQCVRYMTKAYKQRLDLAVNLFNRRGHVVNNPRGAFYLLIDIAKASQNSMDFVMGLLDHKKVAVAPGETFGEIVKDYVRISLATNEELLEEGINRLCDYMAELH